MTYTVRASDYNWHSFTCWLFIIAGGVMVGYGGAGC
jgi:hypothetical protein